PQFRLAVVWLTSAVLMLRTYWQIASMDLGSQPDHVLTMRIALPTLRYPDGATVTNFARQLVERVRALPGVVDVAVSSRRRMEGGAADALDFSVPGRPLTTVGGTASAAYRVVRASYLSL